jgi:hypothetical protein
VPLHGIKNNELLDGEEAEEEDDFDPLAGFWTHVIFTNTKTKILSCCEIIFNAVEKNKF